MGRYDARPRTNPWRIRQFAELIREHPIGQPLNFYSFQGRDGNEVVASDMYPPLFSHHAIEFFFFACIHQYGFWHGTETYEGALTGILDGKKVKGSDLLWRLLIRAIKHDPDALLPKRLATMWTSEYCRMFSDDNGLIPLLTTTERLDLTRAYGEWFSVPRFTGSKTPTELVAFANDHKQPLRTLEAILTDSLHGIPGYREDPLKKKATLLLMSMVNRPEHFMVPESDFVWSPVVDYHLMRLALRLGLITLPADWATENSARMFVPAEREHAIRETVFRAIQSVITISERSMAEVDHFMWQARRFCPEIEVPDCGACILNPICAKKIALFQPIIRTTAY